MIVSHSVNFDDKAFGQTAEIGDIRTYRMLPAKFVALRAETQSLPKQTLGKCHGFAQLASEHDNRPCLESRLPSTALRAVPLPGTGRLGRALLQPASLSFTIFPPWVSRTALPISSSSTGRPCSLSQKAERKL